MLNIVLLFVFVLHRDCSGSDLNDADEVSAARGNHVRRLGRICWIWFENDVPNLKKKCFIAFKTTFFALITDT